MSNLTNSIDFLLSARETLGLLVAESYVDNNDELCNFIQNEATDFQILHLLMTNELPSEKQNLALECELLEGFKKLISKKIGTLSEKIDYENLDSLTELTSTSLANVGTATPVLEHVLNVGLLEAMPINPTEVPFDTVNRFLRSMGAHKVMSDLKFRKLVAWTSNKASDAVRAGKNPGAALNAIRSDIAHKINTMGTEIGANAITTAQKLDPSGDLAIKAGKAYNTLGNTGTVAVVGLGGAALATAVIYSAYKIYKNFFSKAAQACRGKEDKKACMAQYKAKATQMQIAALRKGKSSCKKSKNPEKCSTAIDAKIEKLSSKI